MLRDERNPLDLTLGFFHVLPEPEAHSKGCTNQKYQDAAGVYRRKWRFIRAASGAPEAQIRNSRMEKDLDPVQNRM
jgi:hypothetical protein